MTERKRGMDFMGILKDAWRVTRENRSLWILGLFAGGSAGASSINWNTGGNDMEGFQELHTDWPTPGSPGVELQRGLDELGRELGMSLGTVSDWVFWLVVVALVLIVIGIVFWAIGVAARGGLIEQTREALAGRETSARAGWRTGFRYWGRVFAVGFLLGLPVVILGFMALLAFLILGGLAFFSGDPQVTAGLVGMGAILSLIGLLAVVVAIIMGMLHEVALRHALLEDRTAIDSIKASWADLWGRRSVASMWLVMIVVNICAGIVAGILFVPLALLIAFIVAGAVVAGGPPMLWLLAPLSLLAIAFGFLFKAVYSTYVSAAWTSFFTRMDRPELATAA